MSERESALAPELGLQIKGRAPRYCAGCTNTEESFVSQPRGLCLYLLDLATHPRGSAGPSVSVAVSWCECGLCVLRAACVSGCEWVLCVSI